MKNYIYSILFLSILFSSCLTTKTTVGSHKEETGKEYTYDKARQIWLFWGIAPLGRVDAKTPSDGSCEIITRFRLGDGLISVLTLGIVTSYSIIVKDKK